MDQPNRQRRVYQFGVFQATVATGELHRHGVRLKIQDQPFQVLTMLLERPGELVSREEIKERLWGQDTFVDFDHSLNISINKLRETLGDSANAPRYIETIPRRGYRFLAPVQVLSGQRATLVASEQSGAVQPNDTAEEGSETSLPAAREELARKQNLEIPRRRWLWVGLVAALVLLAGVTRYLVRHAMSSGDAAGRPVRLAVLPFENLSGNSVGEYFIAGLHEELIAQLGRVHPDGLNLIARASTAHYGGGGKSVRDIGRDLNVNYILDGTIRHDADRYHITTELIRVSDQTQVRRDSYDLKMGEMLNLQMSLAHRVADVLRVEFSPEAQEQIRLSSTSNGEAYDAYLRGRALWYEETKPGLEAAIQEFERAIQSDPHYAPAYVGLADSYNVLGGYGLVPPDQTFPQGRAAAEKALQLSPNFSDAYNSIGFSRFYYDWDWQGAEASFRKAIQLNPNNQLAHLFFGSFLHAMGRLTESESENRIGRELDPQSPWGYDDYGWLLLTQHKPEEAIAQFKKAMELSPKFAAGHLSLAVAYIRTHRYKEAIEETSKAEAANGDPTRVLEVLGSAQALGGDAVGARATLDKLLNKKIAGHVSQYSIALIYTALGSKKEAIDWLENGYQEKDPWLPWIRPLVEWDSLRTEPRFIELLQRMNFQTASRSKQ